MSPKSTVLAAFVAAAFTSSAAIAQSPNMPNPPRPPAPDMAGNPETPKMAGDASKVESDYRSAQTSCNAQPAATRDPCLRDAKSKYDRDLRRSGTPPSPMTHSNSGGAAGTSGSTGTAGDNGGHSGGTGGAGTGPGANK